MSKFIEGLCNQYQHFPDELIQLLRQICVCRKNTRRRRRAAHAKLEELCFIEHDDSIHDNQVEITDSDCSDSSVSSASSGSSENSFNQERTRDRMGLNERSSMFELLEFERYQREIKNDKKAAKTDAKRVARRRSIAAKKASRQRDAIQNALRNPVKNFSFLLQQAGFRYVFLRDENKYAFVWITMHHQHEIVLFKGVSSPSKKDICEEIGQRAWQYLMSGKLNDVYSSIYRFIEGKKKQDESETETSTFVQSLFAPAATDASDAKAIDSARAADAKSAGDGDKDGDRNESDDADDEAE